MNFRKQASSELVQRQLDLVACPECAMPAEVERRDVLGSTSGLVEMIKIRCLDRHWFYMPVSSLSAGP
jgi:hypothetical protein